MTLHLNLLLNSLVSADKLLAQELSETHKEILRDLDMLISQIKKTHKLHCSFLDKVLMEEE